MSEVKVVDLADVLKAKGRYTDMRLAALAMGFKNEFTVKDPRFPQGDHTVVAINLKNKRKLQNLNARMSANDGGLILEGWNVPVYLDTDSKRRFTGSATMNLWSKTDPADLDTAKKIIAEIASRLVFNNLSPRIGWRLYAPDLESHIDIPRELLEVLPRHALAGEPYVPPQNKCPLTEKELEKLRQAEKYRAELEVRMEELEDSAPDGSELAELKAAHRALKPLYKLFTPAGAFTWLLYGLDEDGDTLWGVADLGMQCVEYGSISLKHDICGPHHRMPVEKDKHFEGAKVAYSVLELCGEDQLPGNLYEKA